MRRAERRWTAPAAVTGLVLAAYGHLVVGRPLAGYDITNYTLPYRVQVARALRSLRLPQWDPLRFGGAPLLANPQAAVLYPPHWLLLPLPADRAHSVALVLHVLLAAAGTYAFARRALGRSAAAALLAGAAFGLGGFVHGHLGHFEQATALAWLPWALLAGDRALAAPGPRAAARPVAGLAAALALTALAGHTQYLHMAVAAVALYAVVLSPCPRSLARVGTGVVLGFAVAAAQLLPTALAAGESVRAGGLGLDAAAAGAVAPGELWRAVVAPVGWSPPASVEHWGWLAVTVLALGAVGLAARPGRREAALATVAAAGTVLALGAATPAFHVAYDVVPGFDLFREPGRWLLLPSVALPLLAAGGLDTVRRWVAVRRPRLSPAAVALLVVVAAAELLAAGRSTYVHDRRTGPGSLLEPSATAAALGSVEGRVLALGREPLLDFPAQRHALRPNAHVFDGLRSFDGYDGGVLLTPQWSETVAALTRRAAVDPGNTARAAVGRRPLDPELFAELDITRVVVHPAGLNVGPLLPPGSERTDTVGEVAVWRTPSYGPVFLEGGDVPAGLRLVRQPDRPELLVVHLPQGVAGRTVVVSEAHAPGWSASGDVPLRAHRGYLLSFEAPAGVETVTLRYRTPGLAAGAAISLVSLALVTGAAVWGRSPREQEPGPG